ncbi:MAG TPA: DUF2490 domain-containing protein [Gammaproteobacteria bacterium]|nr:DUF2490 domain-containing protein [Gammaproteobacteria bacterium]
MHRYVMKKVKGIFFLFILLLFYQSAFSVEEHTKLWFNATVLGSFQKDSPWKYYLEPQLRFIDDPYKFNQVNMAAGAGYQTTPDMILLGGLGWYLTKTLSGNILHEYRLWQQLNWMIPPTPTYALISRSRLEERRLAGHPGIAYRFRERLFARIPFKRWPTHSLALYDEIFLNLNQPDWAVPHFFEQNRAFMGIGTELTKTIIFDIGYLNQYVMTSPRQMDNVLLVSLTATS